MTRVRARGEQTERVIFCENFFSADIVHFTTPHKKLAENCLPFASKKQANKKTRIVRLQ